MAITWDIEFAVTNLAEKRVRVTAKRTDDVAGTTWTKSAATLYNTATETKGQFLTRIKDTIWNSYQAYLAEQASYASLLSDWENLIEAALDAEEVA